MTIEKDHFQTQPRSWLGILGVVFALSAPVVQRLMVPWLESTFEFPVDRFVSLLVFWVILFVVLGLAYFVEGYSLASFGFRRSEKTLRARLIEWIVAVLSAVAVAAVIITFSGFVRDQITGAPSPVLDFTRTLPAWLLVSAWVTGSFTEEVLFRSYPIERLTQIMGKRWLSGLITMLAFTLLHLLSWDWIHVLTVVLPGSIMITLLYLWKRSLAFVVIVHAIINAPLLLLPVLAPYL
jgi:membrane protease YdiL (CAAX protease family)